MGDLSLQDSSLSLRKRGCYIPRRSKSWGGSSIMHAIVVEKNSHSHRPSLPISTSRRSQPSPPPAVPTCCRSQPKVKLLVLASGPNYCYWLSIHIAEIGNNKIALGKWRARRSQKVSEIHRETKNRMPFKLRTKFLVHERPLRWTISC